MHNNNKNIDFINKVQKFAIQCKAMLLMREGKVYNVYF